MYRWATDPPACVCVTDWKFGISEHMFDLRRLNLPVIKNKHHMMDGSRKKIFPSPSSFFFGASEASYPGVTLNRFDLQFRRVMCLLKVSSVRTGIKAEPRRGGTPGSVSQPRRPADVRTYRSHLAPKEAIFLITQIRLETAPEFSSGHESAAVSDILKQPCTAAGLSKIYGFSNQSTSF